MQRQQTQRVAFTIMHFKNDMKNLPQTEWIELRQKKNRGEKRKKKFISSDDDDKTMKWEKNAIRNENGESRFSLMMFRLWKAVMHRMWSGRNRWEEKKRQQKKQERLLFNKAKEQKSNCRNKSSNLLKVFFSCLTDVCGD